MLHIMQHHHYVISTKTRPNLFSTETDYKNEVARAHYAEQVVYQRAHGDIADVMNGPLKESLHGCTSQNMVASNRVSIFL